MKKYRPKYILVCKQTLIDASTDVMTTKVCYLNFLSARLEQNSTCVRDKHLVLETFEDVSTFFNV